MDTIYFNNMSVQTGGVGGGRKSSENIVLVSQKCSSYDPLPKLLKWFCLAEQNGNQS